MLPATRLYHDDRDLTRMLALLQAGRASGSGAYYIHTGDLKWWLYYPPLGARWWEHIHLWEDSVGRLLGFALLEPTGETFDVYCQPDLHGTALASAMYAWAEHALVPIARAAGRGQIGVYWVVPEDSARIDWLEQSGYRMAAGHPAFQRDLAGSIPAYRIPGGFQVRSCRGLPEVHARARAQYAVFGSAAPFKDYLEHFTRFMQSPVYSSNADVVAIAPDGRIAAFCIIWTDSLNRTGLFEPVGTQPAFQRMRLGSAVMLEALGRLRAQGLQQAIVCTVGANTAARHLYESIGFRQYSTFHYYTKNLD